jgi:predicted site-specific integrase-resolvase
MAEAIVYLRMNTKWSRRTLSRWSREGRIKAVKPKGGKTYFYKQEWLDAFLMGKP